MSLRAEHERKHAAVERQRQELAARRRALAEQHRLQQRQLRVKHKTMAAVESSGVSSLLARRVSQRKRRKQADELQAQHAQQQREHKAAAAREAETLPRASPSTPPPCGTRRRRARPTPRCRVTPRAEEVARLREAHVAEAAGGGGSKRTESRGSRFVSESRGSKRFVTGVSIVKERASVRSGPTSCCARFGCATRGRVEATEEGREGKERVNEGKEAASDWCVRHHAQSRLERQERVTSARRRDYVSARVASCVSAPSASKELRGPIQKLYIGPALHVRNAGSLPREFLILRSVAGVVQRPPSRTGFPLSCPFNILHYTRGTIRERAKPQDCTSVAWLLPAPPAAHAPLRLLLLADPSPPGLTGVHPRAI